MQGWGGGCIANSAIVRGGELEEGAHSGGKLARDVELGAFFFGLGIKMAGRLLCTPKQWKLSP